MAANSKVYVLGISCFYHDSAAALICDGQVVAAAQEERFSRKKHDIDFPMLAIDYCLGEANITINDVQYIAFYEKPLLKFERLLSQHLEKFPKSYHGFISNIPEWFNEKLKVRKIMRKKLKYTKSIFFIPHHLAHASSFFISPFKQSAIVCADGVGEWATTSIAFGEKNKIKIIKEIQFPHSLGLLYSTVTAYLGFSVNNSEYKVMGLAPYGLMNREKNRYYHLLKKTIDLREDGSYHLNMRYFVYHYKKYMPSKDFCNLIGGPVRKKESAVEQNHKDIAAAVQMILEDAMIPILNEAYKVTKSKNLILSGGVALNSVFNGKILSNTPFTHIWIQPDPGDGGTSLSAAYFAYNFILNNPRNFVLKDPYLGPEYTTEEIRKFFEDNKVKYSEIDDPLKLNKFVAKLLIQNKVIGWFQGRMEWGPRALGSRSILSNPCNPDMQEILNVKVKHREKFRPFAPVVCAEDASVYFQCDSPIPEPTDFMLMVYPVKKRWRAKIPAVTHIDGSGRLQTIREFQNPRYHGLIKEFGKLSKIPILINTSFNIRGEPIVCTPSDAYRCMMGTGIDYLIIDKFIVRREDNLADIWDSESIAND